jgi:hypothetical protein
MAATLSTTTCPGCGAAASGKFCANCGASLAESACAGCGAALSPGAKFCHRCGTAVGAAAPRRSADGLSSALPWAVAGIALLALIVLVAAPRVRARTASQLDAPLNALPQAGLDDRGQGAAAGGAPSGARAVDLSQMTPREQAARLFDRVMRLDEEGKKDSVQFFAPMAIQAYQMLDSLDLDARYDMGRIAEAADQPRLARAAADSILARDPNHLLGLVLAASASRTGGDEAAARRFEQKLLAVEPAETRRALPEYQAHRHDIDEALKAARRTGIRD